jgi:hypothetical protein
MAVFYPAFKILAFRARSEIFGCAVKALFSRDPQLRIKIAGSAAACQRRRGAVKPTNIIPLGGIKTQRAFKWFFAR